MKAAFSMTNLVTAYRKAKVDLFYSSDPRRLDLVTYEENLAANLARLLERITGDGEDWVSDPIFLGGFTFAPKALSEPQDDRKSFWSIPTESWRSLSEQSERVPVAEFRLMSRCSIDMHVLSSLWMLEVGSYLDAQLRDNAMGSRLRRVGADGPNQLGTGTFLPYQVGYQRWRDGGLTAMTDALTEGADVVALTADVTSFYHHLDPVFMLDADFLSGVLGINLTADQEKLTRLFVTAVHSWSASVAAHTGWRDRGLPVGLPASAVIANLALAEFDSIILNNIRPLYYGRYVDDVLLVIKDPGSISNQRALWEWLVERSRGLLTFESPVDVSDIVDTYNDTVYFRPHYLQRSVIAFENRKNKTFHLRGRSGMALIESIRSTIQKRSSEWRLLANVPGEVDQIESAIASVRRLDGDDAVTLRDADRVSARKQSFAVRLRDFESLERNLPPNEWEAQRGEFFRVCCEQMLALPTFFDLVTYLPRLVALGASCRDVEALAFVFVALSRIPNEVSATCRVAVAAFDTGAGTATSDGVGEGGPPGATIVLSEWTRQLIRQATENLVSGWRGRIPSTDLKRILAPLRQIAIGPEPPLPGVASLQSQHMRMAQRDLAHRPYRWSVLGLANADRVKPVQRAPLPLNPTHEAGLNLLVGELRRRQGRPRRDLSLSGSLNAGLAFATRPPSAMELFESLPAGDPRHYGVANSSVVGEILTAMRGWAGYPPVDVKPRSGRPTVIHVATSERRTHVRVALTMLDTDVKDAVRAIKGDPNLSIERLTHLRELLNSVAIHRDRPEYLLLPEVAIPARWFPELARGLRRSGISLVAGIEHQPRESAAVVNQVWAALRLDGIGLPFFLYKQDKQRPARPEVDKLLRPLGKSLKPARRWKLPPTIEHSGFRFAMLICSELTNIDYRAHLRGAIDALFIPEWNQDLHSFEALVESAALDIHSYIAQANTRGFGDTRLRAPMANEWERDVVRLKGGSHDYFVVGQVNFGNLRAFQAADGVPQPSENEERRPLTAKTYKPLPDGFDMDPGRT